MTAADNKQLVQRIFAALAEGDGRPPVDAMAEDFRWTIAGTSSWSRTYAGKQSVRAELLAPLNARLAPPIRVVAQRMVAEDDRVVVEARGQNSKRDGEHYENAYCFVFRLAEGRLAEVTNTWIRRWASGYWRSEAADRRGSPSRLGW